MKVRAVRNLRLCTKDCLCLYVCPTGATDTEDSIIDADKCTGCGMCANACPSGAISMVPYDYPVQQKKTESVKTAILALAKSKSDNEKAALEAAENSDKPGLKKLMKAIAKSERLIAEDLMREGGYMLPQSKNSHDLLKTLIADPPSASFPLDKAKELLRLVKCNEEEHEGGRYRCSVCFTEFETEKGEEAVCPMCRAQGDDLERLKDYEN